MRSGSFGFGKQVILALALLSAASRALSDQSPGQLPPPFPLPGQNQGRQQPGQETEQTDPALRRAQEEAAKRRNVERQDKMQASAARIVQLAQELNTNPTAHDQAKQAGEIEKLARAVRDLMRSQ